MSIDLTKIRGRSVGGCDNQPPSLPTVQPWPADVPCRFFGPDDAYQDATAPEVADWCADCPVRARCAQAALDNAEQWGVWAGVALGLGRPLTRNVLAGRRAKLRQIARSAT